ncbi:MAG: glycerophosphodiester phosphodiesterase family protein [Pseudomonadota bacterium]
MTLTDPFRHRPLAHRGFHEARDARPENSRAAIKAAVRAGYGIEVDVQLSRDNVAMVFHDYLLDRVTTAQGAVRQKNAADLAEICLQGTEEGIPTLVECLELINGRVPLLVELKDQDGEMGPNVGELERAVAQALCRYPGPIAVMSFNPHSVKAMGALLPAVPRGLVTCGYPYEEWPLPAAICDRLRQIPDYARIGASFISHEVTDLTSRRVRELKAQGALVFCWTVRSVAEEAMARQIADNITFEGYAAALPS